MTRARGPLTTRAALATPAIAFLAIFFAWPLAAIIERSLGGGSLPFDVLQRRSTLEILWFTVWQAGVSTALTLVVGLPLAWALSRGSFRGRSSVEALVLVPFVLPTVVVATSFIALLPDGVERSVWAILAAHVFFNIAVVVRVVGTAWSALDPRLTEVATTLGAGPFMRARSVTAPLLMPSLAAASSIVFLFCFTSFGVIVVLGGPGFATLETEIYTQAVRLFDLRTAAALALLQLAAVAVVTVACGVLERRAGSRSTWSGAQRRVSKRDRRRVGLVTGVSLAVLALAPVALVWRSLSVGGSIGFRHFTGLTHETPALLVAPWHAVVNSLAYAGAATVIALSLGIPAAIAIAHGARALNVFVMLPLGASAAMLGFGFLLAFDDPPLDLRSSRAIVPLAQALVALPFVIRSLTPALRGLDPRLHDAAAALGAHPGLVRRTIDLPLLARPLAVAAGLAFAVALGEFGATVFLVRADTPTLPVAAFRFLGRPGADNVGAAMALCVVLMALVVLVALVSERALVRREAR